MKKSITTSLKISAILIGSVIGAGFATGKEIVTFFGFLGVYAPLLIVVASIGLYCGFYLFLNASKYKQNIKANYFFDTLIFVSIFIILSTMISGLNYINSLFFPQPLIMYFLLILSYVVIVAGLKGLSISNVIITPVLIGAILTISLYSLLDSNFPLEIGNINGTFIHKSLYFILFFGLNLFTSYPLCRELGKNMSKKEIKLSSFIVSLCLFVLVFLVYIAIMSSSDIIYQSDMPLVFIACQLSPIIGFIYYIVLVLAILTTLFSCGFILLNYGKRFKINKYLYVLLFLTLAFYMSKLGFGNIVSYFYPLIGIFGIALMIITYINKKQTPSLSLGSAINNPALKVKSKKSSKSVTNKCNKNYSV